MTDRWIVKANALLEGCKVLWPQGVPRQAVLLGLSVAQHETVCGDAWPNSNNWGAVQWRTPSADEHDQILNGKLVKGSRIPGGILERDSSPVTGGYWVWFRAFDTEAAGATFFANVLYGARPRCRLVAERGDTPNALALEMYRSRYFEGVHNPKPLPGEKPNDNGLFHGGQANVDDYAGALNRLFYPTQQALLAWNPPGLGLTTVDTPAAGISEETSAPAAPEDNKDIT